MNQKKQELFLVIGLSLLFGASQSQLPLYSSNQNTYFLHGMAASNYGALSQDWMANQTDPVVLFSQLVKFVLTYFDEEMFYVLYGFLAAIFALSLYLVVRKICFRSYRPVLAVSFFLGLTVVSVLYRAPIEGVADQQLLQGFLEPSVFGVLILLSIALFLHQKYYWSIAALILGTWFHPTYLMHAAFIVIAYMGWFALRGRYLQALLEGVFALVLVLPLVVFIYLSFGNVDGDLLAQSEKILVFERFPHHALISEWFGRRAAAQLFLVLVALAVVWRKPEFPILFIPFLLSLVISAATALTGSLTLALMFPWRTSVWLVPVASAILMAAVLTWIEPARVLARLKIRPAIFSGLSVVILLSLAVFAISRTVAAHQTMRANKLHAYLRTLSPGGGSLLLPVRTSIYDQRIANIRVNAGIPVFVEWKSHPYRADQVMSWYNRVKLARAFYGAKTLAEAKATFSKIMKEENVGYVLVEKLKPGFNFRCEIVYEDETYRIYKVMACLGRSPIPYAR